MVQYSFTTTETRSLVRTDSPGRPPRLSHSSWTTCGKKGGPINYRHTSPTDKLMLSSSRPLDGHYLDPTEDRSAPGSPLSKDLGEKVWPSRAYTWHWRTWARRNGVMSLVSGFPVMALLSVHKLWFIDTVTLLCVTCEPAWPSGKALGW